MRLGLGLIVGFWAACSADVDPDTCAVDRPEGSCPSGATCDAGRCRVDMDPGDDVGDALADWTAFRDWAEPRDLLVDRHPVSWSDVDAWVTPRIEEATSRQSAVWAMTQGVMQLRSGHTYIRDSAICDHDPGLSERRSTLGACVTEVDGELIVYAVEGETGFELGDRLIAIDGRPAEELLADRLEQPRCFSAPPTDEGRRANAVVTMMAWPQGETLRVSVERMNGKVARFKQDVGAGPLCGERIADAAEVVQDIGHSVGTLPGGVSLIYLPYLESRPASTYEDLVTSLEGVLAEAPDGPLIIDIRGAQGGYPQVADVLASWIVPEDTVIRRCSSRNGSGPEERTGLSDVLSAAAPGRRTGKVAVITNSLTYGAPEHLALAVAESGVGILVGSPTHGSPSITWSYQDGGIQGAIDGVRCEHLDGTPLEGLPPAVDVAVSMTREDIAAGVDTILEAARTAVLAP